MRLFANVLFCILFQASSLYAQAQPGVRAQSLGGAYRALVQANDGMFYNPAGLIKNRRFGSDLDYMLDSDLSHHRLTFSVVDSKTTDGGLGLAYSAGFFSKSDRPADHQVTLNLAMPILSDMFALGACFNYINDQNLGPKPFEHFFNMDLGILFNSDVGFRFAVVLDHLLRPKGLEKNMGLSFGSAFEFASVLPTVPLSVAFDWSIHNVASLGSLEHAIGAGLEFVAMSLIPLRAGFRSDPTDDAKYVSLGAGVMTGQFVLDALYQQHLSIGRYRNFGLALRVNI